MFFEEAIKHLRAGKKLVRPGWPDCCHLHRDDSTDVFAEDLLADDWEVRG